MNSNEIKLNITEKQRYKAAKIAGFMFLCSLFIPALNWSFILSKFIVSGNEISTAQNILADKVLFLSPSFSSISFVKIIGLGPYVLFIPIIGFWLLIKGLKIQEV